MPPVTRRGDKCTGHGSWVPRSSSSGSPNVFVNSIPVHRQGDGWNAHASPSPNPPHGGSLASGSSTVFINNKQCGRIGDPVSCGSAVAQGSANVFAGG
jgi:uncharacterized Zn-binding protein involved in type VI secretion